MAAWGSEQETNPKTTFPGVQDVPPPGGTGGTGNDPGSSGGAGNDDDSDDSGSGGAGGLAGDEPDGPFLPWGGSSGGCGCAHAGLSYAPQGLWAALICVWWLRRRRRATAGLS